MRTYFLYIHPPPPLINFYSDSSFRHSQFLGYFHFYSLRGQISLIQYQKEDCSNTFANQELRRTYQ